MGFWAGLITCSTIVFTVSARAATVDSALTLRHRAGDVAVRAGEEGFRVQGQGHPNPNPKPIRNPNLPLALRRLMYACIGLAVLAKGPVGMLLPLAAMGLYMLVANGWRNLLRSAWQMRPFTALIVIAAVAVPWYIEVGIETHGEWLRSVLREFNLRPFRQPIQTHGDVGSCRHALAMLVTILYYFYHVPGILFGFFPWAVFLGPASVDAVRGIRGQRSEVRGQKSEAACGFASRLLTGGMECLLASCWFGVWFVFWSVCKTKLPHYLLPAYPALALLVACWIDRWLGEKKGTVASWGPRNAWISTILAGVGIVIAVPIVAAYRLPGEEWLGLVGLILVLGGGWCWWESAHQRRRRAATVFALTSVAFLTAVFGFAALRVDQHQNAKPMIAAIHARLGKESRRHRRSPPTACSARARCSTPAGR